MARGSKRKHVTPAASGDSGDQSTRKRQRKPTQVFEQGVNPAPPSPPPTAKPAARSRNLTLSQQRHSQRRNRAPTQPPEDSPSLLFEPEPSQLAIDAQTDDILGFGEDEDVSEEVPDPLLEEEEVTWEDVVSGGEEAASGEAAGGDLPCPCSQCACAATRTIGTYTTYRKMRLYSHTQKLY
jgi:hypothetical protein